MDNVFETLESEVRSYCRGFPAVFERAKGHLLWDEQGKRYVDFFGGAGALNYGHNNDRLKRRLLEYIEQDGITHSLDMASTSKRTFLERFDRVILQPRGLSYKIQFPGPTGTNAVESAMKLARKVTGRETIIGFTNGYHGMTIGALAVTGNNFKRSGAGIPLGNAVSMPYDGYLGDEADTIDYLEKTLEDQGSGLDLPAAMIVETVQGEGGINVASMEWLQRLEALCRRWEILLILDDIQAGCGRTGTFFSFEPAGIKPDMVCLSKSIGGYGLPMALVLIRPELDVWEPGEHNGTFRGNNLAFVTGAEALAYWEDDSFAREIRRKGEKIREGFDRLVADFPKIFEQARGRGMMQGLVCHDPDEASRICAEAFRNGLLLETAGGDDEVIKCLAPLTIDDAGIEEGLETLRRSVEAVASDTDSDDARVA
ncbi:MAG TPA: diaminobutyrate--2-oxoglutarate transaminase [Gammaproteobacteria bacterium]|nr:diaminobutyrate--2-oxoglutarate transaminase [Gammaproteobacteria bacterium]